MLIQQAAHRVGNVQVTQLSSSSLKELCMADETLLRRKMAFVQRSDNLRVALIPDLETFNWHHAREEFFADKLFGHRADSRGRLEPFNKGVLVTNSSTNKRAWCVWSHSWRSSKEDGILYILRLVLEEEATWDLAGASEDEKAEKISLMAKLLQSAQEEAGLWGMRAVQLWNPTPTQEALISLARPDAITFEREKDSIPCLMWYGEASQNNIEWIGNEKFAWC
ncbi:MAG: hypothetical protein M1829_004743 [Trizodia sp. TS-e1964]|nr:MAG: hypothetical protein M1829_004743 [Trizodia sp. TS-e1964]